MKCFTLTIVLEANGEADFHLALDDVARDLHQQELSVGEGTDISGDVEYRWELKDGEQREHLPPDLR